jgi:hypothetical protein
MPETEMRDRWISIVAIVMYVAGFGLAQAPTRARLAGEVVDSRNGKPLAGVKITLKFKDQEPFSTITDNHGHFRFTGEFAAGHCALDAVLEGYLGPGEYNPLSTASGAGHGMNISLALPPPPMARELPMPAPPKFSGVELARSVGTDGVLDVFARIRTAPAVVLKGRVINFESDPRPGGSRYFVEVIQKAAIADGIRGYTYGEYLQQKILPDGKHQLLRMVMMPPVGPHGVFEWKLEPGSYYLRVSTIFWSHSEAFRTTYYPGTTEFAKATLIDLPDGGTRTGLDIRISDAPPVRVTGKLIPPEEQPIKLDSSPTLVFESQEGDELTAQVESTGEFKILLRPGEYTLRAYWDNVRDPRAYSRGVGARQKVEIGESGLEDLRISLAPMPLLRGQVRFDKGCATPPVNVRMDRAGNGGPPLNQGIQAMSAPDGTFVLRGLKAASMLVPKLGSPWKPLPIVSATYGDRDVLLWGLEFPSAREETLVITAGCEH